MDLTAINSYGKTARLSKFMLKRLDFPTLERFPSSVDYWESTFWAVKSGGDEQRQLTYPSR